MKIIVDFTHVGTKKPEQTVERKLQYLRQDFLQGELWMGLDGTIWHPAEMNPKHAENICRMLDRNAPLYVRKMAEFMWPNNGEVTEADLVIDDDECVEFIRATRIYRMCLQRASVDPDVVRTKIETSDG